MNRTTYALFGAAALAVAALFTFQVAFATPAPAAVTTVGGVTFEDVPTQTRQFIAWYDSIQLTPAQEAIRVEALSAIPAPCCSDNSAATCCCPCNMAKSVWGLSKYLITEKGAGVDEVRKAAQDWFGFINPEGFSGDVCYTGGCGRAFHENGCGGMRADRPVF